MRLTILPGRFAVCRLGPQEPVPAGIADAGFVSVTRTADELSIVCVEALAPEGGRTEKGWKCLAVQGPIPFTATGILSSLLAPLAQAAVGIFAISTYDTDYVLLKEAQLGEAVAALKEAGHEFGD
jgi:hypothetical protein